jgi:hypothetical protein
MAHYGTELVDVIPSINQGCNKRVIDSMTRFFFLRVSWANTRMHSPIQTFRKDSRVLYRVSRSNLLIFSIL